MKKKYYFESVRPQSINTDFFSAFRGIFYFENEHLLQFTRKNRFFISALLLSFLLLVCLSTFSFAFKLFALIPAALGVAVYFLKARVRGFAKKVFKKVSILLLKDSVW